MAQWVGQYTGNTHATHVAELDEQLRHAISAFRTSGGDIDRRKRGKSIRSLAKRLWAARRRFVKAKIVGVEIRDASEKRTEEIGVLREHLAAIDESGVDGILAEFGVAEELRELPSTG